MSDAPTPHQPVRSTDRPAEFEPDTLQPPGTSPSAGGTGGGSPVLAAGSRPLPEYELVSLLGRGGFGEVWKAAGPGGFEVALKFIRLGEQAGSVEVRALELMKGIRHPHLLPMFGAWQRGDLLVIAMELADRTLWHRWREAADRGLPGIPPAELFDYLHEAAKGIDYLNEYRHPAGAGGSHGIQHKDIKPANLLLVGGAVKVADFGLAKVLEHTVTNASGGLTPAYAAPEFFQGRVTQWSDQYSLAVSYCQLRGGRLPFEGGQHVVMFGHLQGQPDLTMLPEAERPAVARALAKKPEERWLSCREFALALARVADGGAPTRSPPAAAPVKPQAAATAPPTAPAGSETATLATHVSPAPAAVTKASRPRRRGWPFALAGATAVGVGAALLVAYSVGPPRPTGHREEAVESPSPTTAKAPDSGKSLRVPGSDAGKSVTATPPRPAVPEALGREPASERSRLRPPPVPAGPVASLKLLPLSPVRLPAPGKATLSVRVERTNCPGKVELSFDGLPDGVEVSPGYVDAGKDAADLTVTAANSARPGERSIHVTARANGVSNGTPFGLTLSPAGPPPAPAASLRLQPIDPVSLRAGQEASLTVQVRRENCPGRINLTLNGLPAGVKAWPLDVEPGEDRTRLTLTADADAPAAEVQVTVTAWIRSVQDERHFRLDLTAAARQRPRPLDCTGPDGVSAADVRKAQEAWANYLGRKVEETVKIADEVEMTFVLVPPGKFRMGSPGSEKDRDEDETQHTVVLTEPFDMGKYEVTQKQYEALTRTNPSNFKGPDFPVESVSWEEADDYRKKLTEKPNDKHTYRLPSEAEWEYACRGGRPSSQPFGIGDGRSLSSREANFGGWFPYGGADTGPDLHNICAVGSYKSNALGLFDMHGNVLEWCADRFGTYPGAEVTNPTGPSEGPYRVIRGGGWRGNGGNCRAAYRRKNMPGDRYSSLGFRLARTVPLGGK